MPNIIWGSIVVVICIAGYWQAWRLSKSERYGAALALVTLCGLILRVYTGVDSQLHEWDERYHALVAKHLALHPLLPTLYERPLLPFDYTNWTANHIWLHKQPLSLWLSALSIKLFGLHAMSVRIPAILASTFAIKLVYDIGSSWFDRRSGILAAFFFSIHGLIIELVAGRTATDAVDVMLLFFVVLGIWLADLAVRTGRLSHHVLLGAVVGLGLLSKWLPALIVLPVWALLAYPSFKAQRGRLLACLACIVVAAAIVALPWQLYILQQFPKEAHWEYAYNSKHFFQALESQGGGFLYYFDRLRMQYGELIYLAVGWYTWFGLRRGRAVDYALLAWFWIPYLFFSIAATKMQAYTLIAAPAVFLMNALAVFRLADHIGKGRKYKLVAGIVLFGLVALPIRYSIERVKPFQLADREPEWHRQIMALRRSGLNTPRTVFYLCPRPIETMFFTDCIAYEQDIDSATKAQLAENGYTVREWPAQ